MSTTMSAADTVKECLRKNEEEHKSFMEKIDSISDKIEALSVKIAEIPDKILERADKRYASKTAEKVIYGLVGAVCVAFVMALWELISKQ